MKIAVNARLLLKGKLEGIGTFMNETLQRITKAHPEIEFHFFFDRKYDPCFVYQSNVIPHVLRPATRHPLLVTLWFNRIVPRKMKKLGITHVISSDSIGFKKAGINNHLVIHDINFVHRPKDLPKVHRNFYLRNMPIFAKNAQQIATVSQYSKQDLIDTYQLDSEKIDVVYNAAKDIFKPLNASEKKAVKTKYSKGEDFFLFVGSLHPRKNLPHLVSAFFEFKSKLDTNMKLLIVGNVMWETAGLKELITGAKYKDDLLFLGRKSDAELAKILGAAFALTYVPFFEGFGIPIVEAYACKVPVITSNVTCMPEVAGEGALTVNPNNVNEIGEAMMKIVDDPELRQNLIEKGTKKGQTYHWDITAKLYWESIQKILPC